jgi:hypothetical protein
LQDGSRKFGWLKAKGLEADVVTTDKFGAFFKGLFEQTLVSEFFCLFADAAGAEFLGYLF